MSGSHILGPQGPIISFPHNFTKKDFFSKVQLVTETTRSDISKEPIKKVTTGPKRQVAYSVGYRFDQFVHERMFTLRYVYLHMS